ncbi:hypothetical protein GYMLUDRAFT_893540 [Collybiopsis luxurians FD-317 M1]|uniref:Uncharacterized protein n=1 Tax=Collybiopsis luxurians FD-317 M1 TaxID=944289 RepID=A0A0D0BY25_9AGAR|nr:hypothetical protein GYMLUDRAFT_893540 [Collybiopsis luxurians FD-317 M1]
MNLRQVPVPTSNSLPRLLILIVQCILYGAYVVLFGLAIQILPRQFDTPSAKNFFFPVIIALFVLATINITYDLVGEGYAILYTIPTTDEKTWMIAGQSIDLITFAISDFLGDFVLLHRVYTVWGSQKRIFFPILFIVFVAKAFNIIQTVIAVWSPIDDNKTFNSLNITPDFWFLFMVINAFVNTLMTLMIAGRVWWISRAVHNRYPSGPSQLPQQHWYCRTIAVVTESGIIYPTYLIVEALLVNLPVPVPNSSCLGAISVGLAPTLIAVRVGLGSAYNIQSLKQSDIVFMPYVESRRSPSYVSDGGLVSSTHAIKNFDRNSAEDIRDKTGQIV